MSGEPIQVFTLEAINELIPRLSGIVGQQISRRTQIESRLRRLGELTGSVPEEITASESDPPEVRDLKMDLVVRISEYQGVWKEVEAMGAVLKDARLGLLDFYGRVDGKLVWLCWKYGEPECGYYHALDEGFSGRKVLATSMRMRMLN